MATLSDLEAQAAVIKTALLALEAQIPAVSPLTPYVRALHTDLTAGADMLDSYCGVAPGTFSGGGKPH